MEEYSVNSSEFTDRSFHRLNRFLCNYQRSALSIHCHHFIGSIGSNFESKGKLGLYKNPSLMAVSWAFIRCSNPLKKLNWLFTSSTWAVSICTAKVLAVEVALLQAFKVACRSRSHTDGLSNHTDVFWGHFFSFNWVCSNRLMESSNYMWSCCLFPD